MKGLNIGQVRFPTKIGLFAVELLALERLIFSIDL